MTRIYYNHHKEKWYIQPFLTIWYVWIRKMALMIDIVAKPAELKGKPECRRVEYWTDEDPEDLYGKGYRPCRGLHDSITWYGTPFFAKFTNFCEFDINKAFPEKKDTPGTLNDEMESDADVKFKRGLARIGLSSVADWQKIGLMVALGIAVIAVTKFLGFW